MPAKVHHLNRRDGVQPGHHEPGKRGRKPPPPGETARDRFIRIGNRRMENALAAIGLIGNLTAPTYQWTPEDLERMSEALFEQIEKTFARFEMRKKPDKPKFRLG